MIYIFWRKRRYKKWFRYYRHQLIRQYPPKEIRACFSALEHCSPAFSRMRELPKCSSTHNSYSGILQPSTKKKSRAGSLLQLKPNTPTPPVSTAILLCITCINWCSSATLITTLTLDILVFFWLQPNKHN